MVIFVQVERVHVAAEHINGILGVDLFWLKLGAIILLPLTQHSAVLTAFG